MGIPRDLLRLENLLRDGSLRDLNRTSKKGQARCRRRREGIQHWIADRPFRVILSLSSSSSVSESPLAALSSSSSSLFSSLPDVAAAESSTLPTGPFNEKNPLSKFHGAKIGVGS